MERDQVLSVQEDETLSSGEIREGLKDEVTFEMGPEG